MASSAAGGRRQDAEPPQGAGPPQGAEPPRRGRRRRQGGLLKTGEVAERSGLSRQVLYMYVTMGLISESKRTPSGHKLFDESVLQRLQWIHDLQQERGYNLRDIKELFFKRD